MVIDVWHILIACSSGMAMRLKMRGGDRVRGKWEMRDGDMEMRGREEEEGRII